MNGWQCQGKNIEAEKPEPSQAGVVDHVEDSDLQPGEGGPGQDFTCLRVEQEVFESFNPCPVPSFRFYGSASNSLWTLAHVSCKSG